MNSRNISITQLKRKNSVKKSAVKTVSECFETPYNSDQLSELYKINSYHQRCINVKANITAGLGYQIIAINRNIKEDAEFEKVYDFIGNINSNTDSNLIELLIKVQTDYEIFGNGWIEISRNMKGEVANLFHIPSQYVKIKKENGNAVLKVDNYTNEMIQFGENKSFEGNEFIQIKNYNPSDNVYGLPEYISALPVMLLDKNVLEYNINRLINRSAPESLITITGAELNQQQKEEIVEFFENNFHGLENAGKVLLIQNKNKDASISMKEVKPTLLEGVFRNLRKELRDEILSIHGVPPRLVGVVSAGQLGGVGEVKEQNRIFKEIVIAPRKTRLEYHLNEIIQLGLGIKNWKIKLNEYDISDNLDDAKLIEILLRNKIISVDEARERII